MKVLWICHFSNSQIREKIKIADKIFENFIRKKLGLSQIQVSDFAAWITNGIEEFEKFSEVELHVVSPHYNMTKKMVDFQLNGIHYHFFRPDDDSILKKILKFFSNNNVSKYKGNRKIVKKIIQEVNPDIIHMYGAENPYYSITALDIDTNKYPLFVTMQTLMNDDDFKKNAVNDEILYNFRAKIESEILKKVKYIGSSVEKYRNIIWTTINPNAFFFKTYLAVEQKIQHINSKKRYDFVYFSDSISKSADIAIEAFALVQKKYPELTINIIGDNSEPFTENLKIRIKNLGIEKNIFFTGKLQTHHDVMKQIQLSKFALLPLKIDIISGTIREAMFSGLPVVSTITEGTPSLNEKRISVLLSEKEDYQSIANNMIKLIESPEFACNLVENAFITINERWNNNNITTQLVKVYRMIINHHCFGQFLSNDLVWTNPHFDYEK
jgi:glycosyltransferase involved in cell wall biosynthesis